MKIYTLNKHERLKSKKAFEHLILSGKKINTTTIRILYNIMPLERDEPLKAGFSVSKKKFKRAVDRNRIKRRMRESFRVGKTEIRRQLLEKKLQIDILFIFMTTDMQTYKHINEEILIALERLILKI